MATKEDSYESFQMLRYDTDVGRVLVRNISLGNWHGNRAFVGVGRHAHEDSGGVGGRSVGTLLFTVKRFRANLCRRSTGTLSRDCVANVDGRVQHPQCSRRALSTCFPSPAPFPG